MTDRIKIRALDPAGAADGDYVVTVSGGHVTGLTPASPGGGSGVVETIVPGSGIDVDDTDPANPVVSATSGGGSVAVEEDGTEIVADASRLNFTGAGVTVADAGSGEVTVDIPGGGGGGGGMAQSYLGYDAVGSNSLGLAIGVVYLKKITIPAGGGLLASIDVYISNAADSVGTIGGSVNADDAGSPGALLGHLIPPQTSFIPRPAPGTNGPGRWYSIPMSKWLEAGSYWLGVMGVGGSMLMAYDSSGGADKNYTTGGAMWFADGGRYAINSTSYRYSIRGSVVT